MESFVKLSLLLCISVVAHCSSPSNLQVQGPASGYAYQTSSKEGHPVSFVQFSSHPGPIQEVAQQVPVQKYGQKYYVPQQQHYVQQKYVPVTIQKQEYIPIQQYHQVPIVAPVQHYIKPVASVAPAPVAEHIEENQGGNYESEEEDGGISNYEDEEDRIGGGIGEEIEGEEIGGEEFGSEEGIGEGIESGIEGGIGQGIGGGIGQAVGGVEGGFEKIIGGGIGGSVGQGLGGGVQGGFVKVIGGGQGIGGGSGQGVGGLRGIIKGKYIAGHQGQHGFKEGSGHLHNSDKHSAHGEEDDKAFKSQLERNKGEKGQQAKTVGEGYYKNKAGKKSGHHDSSKHYNGRYGKKEENKSEKFNSSKHHKKGEEVTGFHNVEHKNEYKKDKKFHDEDDNKGHFNKYGSSASHHGGAQKAYKKDGKLKSGYHADSAGKKGANNEGHFVDKDQGFKGQNSHNGYHKAQSLYAKEQGNTGGQGFGYSAGQGGQGKYY